MTGSLVVLIQILKHVDILPKTNTLLPRHLGISGRPGEGAPPFPRLSSLGVGEPVKVFDQKKRKHHEKHEKII